MEPDYMLTEAEIKLLKLVFVEYCETCLPGKGEGHPEAAMLDIIWNKIRLAKDPNDG